MLKLENTEVLGWEHAIRGMRNPMNSWEKSDSGWDVIYHSPVDKNEFLLVKDDDEYEYFVGPNDQKLIMNLRSAGTDHRKFMRMITVYVDLTAPLYWWKEFDTYKVGTVANSCSTMHKIAEKEFTLEDFSHEHLIDYDLYACDESECMVLQDAPHIRCGGLQQLNLTINILNFYRQKYLETKSKPMKNETARQELMKKYWWQMIQLLPSSYNQRRTVMLNYEVLANIYKSRRNHKLDEWHTFCDWIEELPYSELITGPSLKDIPISNEIMEEAKRRVHEELNTQWDKFYEMHSGHENVERAVFRIRREDVDAETWDALMKVTQEGKSFHIFEEGKPFEVVPIKEDC